MKKKDPRFPFTLCLTDARLIVRNVNQSLRQDLMELWQLDIFLKDNIIVSQELYSTIRKESTNNVVATQVLDKVFGKEGPWPNYKLGDLLFVRQRGDKEWFLRYFHTFNIDGVSVNCFDRQLKKGFVSSWDYHAPYFGKLPD